MLFPATLLPDSSKTAIVELLQRIGGDAGEDLVHLFSQLSPDALFEPGGLLRHPDRPAALTPALLEAIRGHFALLPLVPDHDARTALLRSGYDSGIAIAQSSLAAFVDSARESLGALEAARVHAAARAQGQFLDNTLMGLLRDQNDELLGKLPGLQNLLAGCTCDECRSAVGPLAYLVDLIDYASRCLKTKPSATDLRKRFFQPFDTLPTSCTSVRTEIRQVRICIEVLRRYLKTIDTTKTKPTLDRAEQEFRKTELLLTFVKLGTAYDEIRLARIAKPEDRKALADRLGIALSAARPDELDQLLLDAQTVTEKQLQDFFGLRRTDEDPPVDPASPPLLAQWRLSQLRQRWFSQDWPVEAFFADAAHYPIIDPDLLKDTMVVEGVTVPGDLRRPEKGQPTYDLWKARVDWAKNARKSLDDEIQANGFTSALKKVFGDPLPDFQKYLDNLNLGRDVQDTIDKLTVLGLSVDGFREIMSVKSRYESGETVDFTDSLDILTQVLKLRQYASWRNEEKRQTIVLGPKDFLIAIEEPHLNRWRANPETRKSWQHALRARSNPALIDPDLIQTFDLSNPVSGDSAYEIWLQRAKWITDLYAKLNTAANKTLAALDKLIVEIFNTTGVDAAYLNKLLDAFHKGVRIDVHLERLTIAIDALQYLGKIRSILTAGAPLLDSEWGDIFSVLLQVSKRREFAEWRDAEQAKSITLSPDFFIIPPPPQPSIPQVSFDRPPLPPWRAQWKAFKDFQDSIEARTEQLNAVSTTLTDLRDAVEDATLPMLRDALKVATGKGTDAEACAKWVQQNLLIDAKASSCQKTTRIAQAIATLQECLFSVRNGLLRQSHPDLVLADGAATFDRAWQWLSSYATWRAAMFVFLYPENILQPSLRQYQTPGFRELVSNIRSSRRLTPEQACLAAKAYYSYLNDISQIRIESTTSALTHITSGKCYDRTSADDRTLVYIFGIGGGSVYWSTYDEKAANSGSGHAQTHWEPVPGLRSSITAIVGSTTYTPNGELQYVYIFARVASKGKSNLVFQRYNTQNRSWAQDATTLEIPSPFSRWRGTVSQWAQKLAPDVPPHIILESTTDQGVYNRSLDEAGTDWEKSDWHCAIDPITSRNRSLLSSVDSRNRKLHYLVTNFSVFSGNRWLPDRIEYVYCPKRCKTLYRVISPYSGGLQGEYYIWDDMIGSPPDASKVFVTGNRKHTRLDPVLLFDWESGSPDPSLPSDNFACRWTGRFTPPNSGTYNFIIYTDDGARIWLGTERGLELILDEWHDGDHRHVSKDVFLLKGRYYSIKIEHYEHKGGAKFKLLFAPTGSPIEFVVTPNLTKTALESHYTDNVDDFIKMPEDKSNYLSKQVVCYFEPERSDDFDIAIHRFKTKAGGDLLTTDAGVSAAGGTGNDYIGIVGYAASSPQTGTVQLYALQAKDKGYYYYSCDDVESESVKTTFDYEAQTGFSSVYVYPSFRHQLAGDGLHGEYFKGMDLIDKKVDVPSGEIIGGSWGRGSPYPADIGTDQFSIRWSGFVQAPATGDYAWYTASDDGVRLWVADEKTPIIDRWFDRSYPATDDVSRIRLVSGQVYPIRVEYYENGGDAAVQVSWATETLSKRSVPLENLFSADPNASMNDYLGTFVTDNYRIVFFTDSADRVRFIRLYPVEDSALPVPGFVRAGMPPLLLHHSGEGSWRAIEDASAGYAVANFTWDNTRRTVTLGGTTGIRPILRRPIDIFRDDLAKDSQYYLGQNATAAMRDYVEEAYYFVPVLLGLQLQQRQEFTAALEWFGCVYDFSSRKKIYYGLIAEEKPDAPYNRPSDWLLDLTFPHAIAALRPNTYTRFTIYSISSCLLDFGDSQFTTDTAESITEARALYSAALALLEMVKPKDACDELIRSLLPPRMIPHTFERIRSVLRNVQDVSTLEEIVKILSTLPSGEDALTKALTLASAAARPETSPKDVSGLLAERINQSKKLHLLLMTSPSIAEAAKQVGGAAAQAIREAILSVTPSTPSGIDPLADKSLRFLWASQQGEISGDDYTLRERFAQLRADNVFIITLPFNFCISPNPIYNALLRRGETNLHKLRNCFNIAGMPRHVDLYAAPTDATTGLPTIDANGQLSLQRPTKLAPTPYRFSVLIVRAKELIAHSQQLESQLLMALERRDAESYSRLRARQDMQVAHATEKLQDLRVKEAEDGVTLAEMQRDRSQLEFDHFDGLLSEGISALEEGSLVLMQLSAATMGIYAALNILNPSVAVSAAADAMKTGSSILATQASFERRQQEWLFQRSLAQQDIRIGGQQIQLARDQVAIVQQERTIASMQSQHADAVVDFLSNKFTSFELYDWMSNVLEGVYNSLLQQTTAVARLAAVQLAFERQEPVQSFIQDDYWEAPNESNGVVSSDGTATTDRHGLTGSARLLQDIYKLDQYAFEKNRRKLNLSKTISLASHDPFAFQQFMETGEISVSTPGSLFDRDFPGHYLRLVRRVRVTVVALIPPSYGIKAALTCQRRSRTIINVDGVFQETFIDRGPDYVALTSPKDASGVFDLDLQPEMELPFEGIGVDTTWRLTLPKAANQFDYQTLSDILLTIDYTALNSPDRYVDVSTRLNQERLSSDRAYSFRYQLADLWFELNNPDQSSTPFSVTFSVTRADFPANLDEIKIQHASLYFGRAQGTKFEIDIKSLYFSPQNTKSRYGGPAKTMDGIVSTRKANGAAWTDLIGQVPFGKWDIQLPDQIELRDHFAQEEITDILLVITYKATTPPWP